MYQVLRLRIYRKHNAKLNKLASAVNFVWNYVNDLCLQMWRRKRLFPSAYDVAEYTKGVTGLGIREWVCDCCGQLNDRDVNAAKNILRFGRETLIGESPVL